MNLWLGVGALISVALIFLLVPLWRTRLAPRLAVSIVAAGEEAGSMPDPRSARARRRWMTLALLGVMPALTAGLYLYLGAPTILQEQALTQAHAAYDTDAMVKALEGKLKAKPDDAEGWYALGRAYIALQRLDEAELALAKAAQLAPKEARMLSQQAEAIALKAGRLDGRPMELVAQALELDYEDEKALELAGLAAYQQQKWAESLHFWRRLMKKLPKNSEFYEEIARAVKIAEGKAMEASGLGERARLAPPEKSQPPH
ncbi:tetratricopeptide repeat protein [Candidatus Skiveiella danica]|uniref:tetratricopeptide repeat protein n=1 Tax=Candidatus Skiveiella danica TaxID=3386177 RepID=UPI001DF2152F|nr:tetratricopeptide repeat protein [Betaproteobacteria bacterium]